MLDPDLALYKGRQYPIRKNTFGIFADFSPDRWVRVLIQRRGKFLADMAERKPRKLLDSDYLLGVYDEPPMGAIRFTLEYNLHKISFLCHTINEVWSMRRFFLLSILSISLLAGCALPEPEVYYSRQVEIMEIRQNEKAVTLTEPAQIEAILSYLRLLPILGTSIPDPEHMASPGVEIILTYIGGQQKHILQKGAYYLSENHNPFYPIDEELGAQLSELLQGIY